MIELMDHQQDWADAILGKSAEDLAQHGWPLFGEAGTGKTYPMCLVAERLVQEHSGHAVFAVPTRLTWNWRHEFQQVCPHIPEVQLLVVGGSAAERAQQKNYIELFGQFTQLFIFIGYDALRIEQQFFQNVMENVTVLALDEAHAIKNRGSQRSRACKSINARFRFTLTGTPVPNRPNDLWSVVHFLDPGSATMRKLADTPAKPGRKCPKEKNWKTYYKKVGCHSCINWRWETDYKSGRCKHVAHRPGKKGVIVRYRGRSPAWGNYESFEDRYCEKEMRKGFTVITGGKNLDHLNYRLEQFGMTRWLIDDVLDLKPTVIQQIRLEPTSPEQQNYQRISRGTISMLLDAENGNMTQVERMHHLTILTYLRQATTLTPTAFAALRGGLLDEILEHSGPLAQDDHSSKEEWLLDFLEGTDGAKMLVYSHWIGSCDHIIHTLRQAGHAVEGVYGRHNKGVGDVDKLMVRFREDPDLRVIVGNESMSEGLNFQAARYVVFFHLDWLPKTTIQFIGRARRIGQEKTVVAYFLSHRNTIDEDMASLCESKQEDSDQIFDPEFSGRSGMFDLTSRSDFINLIQKHIE